MVKAEVFRPEHTERSPEKEADVQLLENEEHVEILQVMGIDREAAKEIFETTYTETNKILAKEDLLALIEEASQEEAVESSRDHNQLTLNEIITLTTNSEGKVSEQKIAMFEKQILEQVNNLEFGTPVNVLTGQPHTLKDGETDQFLAMSKEWSGQNTATIQSIMQILKGKDLISKESPFSHQRMHDLIADKYPNNNPDLAEKNFERIPTKTDKEKEERQQQILELVKQLTE